ncbi:MAG TPA: lysophospholipid acyltransferase family protein [Caulobacteraceae bacterium]|nr:lysophospholipid acyltransferase family protein [Caulobacteraceae bacterium]
MLFVRSLIYAGFFYLWSAIVAVAMLPLLLAPRSWMSGPVRAWAGGTIILLRIICGVRLEVRGRSHLASGAALIAAKHQCMFDTIAPLMVLGGACYVMRDSLLKIPFYGWYSVKQGMIPIDREGHASALRKMLTTAKARIVEGRQVVIFPEGSRMAPGSTGQYKPGVAALYRAIGLPCLPLATNSGIHWPPHGFIRRPGLIVYEFLEPIPAGLDRTSFMAILEERLEAASTALLTL